MSFPDLAAQKGNSEPLLERLGKLDGFNADLPGMPEGSPEQLVSAIESLPLHSHLCLIFSNQEEQFLPVLLFLRAGFERGERCVYFADETSVETVLQFMQSAGINVEKHLQSGALAVLGKRDVYLTEDPSGPGRTIEFLRKEAEATLQGGYQALVVTGEMTWALGLELERLLEYEAKLNHLLAEFPARAICQYNRRRFSPPILKEVIETHSIVISRNQIGENRFYVPPDRYLADADSDRQLDRMLESIRSRTRFEEALQEKQRELELTNRRLIEEIAVRGDLEAALEKRVAARTRELEVASESLRRSGLAALNLMEDAIAERSKAEAALTAMRESELRYGHLFNTISDAVFVVELKGDLPHRFVEVNDAACAQLGYSREQMLGMSPVDIIRERSEFAASNPLGSAEEAGQAIFEMTLTSRTGTPIPVEISARLFSRNGNNFVLAIARDISDRKRAEREERRLQDQLLQSQKMESVGRLAGGVAHDFNNMLGIILGNVDLALEQLEPEHPVVADLYEIRKAAGRSADLTRQLLAFARKETVSPKVLDLNATVESMLKMLRRLIGENIELVWRPCSGIWPIRMDPSQVDHILANLCVNARDAITGVGSVTIETSNTVLDDTFCGAHPGSFMGDAVMVAVNDNGCGMDSATLEKLFEPFFTTKGIGRGTGLGLATVYGVVKQNHGFIGVDSEVGTGTTFRVYFPRYQGKISRTQAEQASAMPQGKGETLLLVEDETSVLEMAQRMLTNRGYRVLKASSPAEAVLLAQANVFGIDLLITDLIMPQMNGRDLAEKLRADRPGLKCLFMSGYTADFISRNGMLETGVRFIQKPFTLKELAAVVRKALDDPGNPADPESR